MKAIYCLFLSLILVSCGSTTGLRGQDKVSKSMDFNKYHVVIINDFTDGTTASGNDPYIISEGKKFADMVASAIKAQKHFDRVERNITSEEDALLIEGKIIKYDEGSAVMRALVGLGTGRSSFDAQVNAKDNKTKDLLASMKVNEMSWALGGAIGVSQDVKSHMTSAAKKICNECTKGKKVKNKSVNIIN